MINWARHIPARVLVRPSKRITAAIDSGIPLRSNAGKLGSVNAEEAP
jgi:hypothetical protein